MCECESHPCFDCLILRSLYGSLYYGHPHCEDEHTASATQVSPTVYTLFVVHHGICSSRDILLHPTVYTHGIDVHIFEYTVCMYRGLQIGYIVDNKAGVPHGIYNYIYCVTCMQQVSWVTKYIPWVTKYIPSGMRYILWDVYTVGNISIGYDVHTVGNAVCTAGCIYRGQHIHWVSVLCVILWEHRICVGTCDIPCVT